MRVRQATFDTLGGSVLVLGYQGDARATNVYIDCARALAEFPGTTTAMRITSPGGTMYPGNFSLEDGVIHWTVMDWDTAEDGCGSVRVDIVDDEGIVYASAEAKTLIFKTRMSGVEPDQIGDWTDAASVALADVRAALLDMLGLSGVISSKAQLIKFEIDDNGHLWMYYTMDFPYRFALEEGDLIVYAY